jgi:hypothetical protein
MKGRSILITFFVFCILLFCTNCKTKANNGNVLIDPYNTPDEVVRAYIDAILADECVLAESLVVPDRREASRHRILQECENLEAPFLLSANIEDVLIEEWNGVTIVTLFGDFYSDLGPQVQRRAYNSEIVFSTEEVNGKWYVKP